MPKPKRPTINKLWLYRYRFYILQIILAISFISLLAFALFSSLSSITDAEMLSAVDSSRLSWGSIANGDIINAPFRALQNLSIRILGLTPLAIKLPSILLAAITGFFLILLINRWHKTNVAVITSLLVIPSVIFLATATSGTPAIMTILFPVLIFWLGSKLAGTKNPSPILSFLFVTVFAISCYTPYFTYIIPILPLLCITHPHLRLFIKRLGAIKLSVLIGTFTILVAPIIIAFIINFSGARYLLLPEISDIQYLIDNLLAVVHSLSRFTSTDSSPILQPLFGISLTLIAIIGVIATRPARHASRYRVLTAFFMFAIITSILDPTYVVTFFLPIALLIAAGINFILSEWYSLFPLNPYPRVIGGILILISAYAIVTSNVQFFFHAPHHIQTINAQLNFQLAALNGQDLYDEVDLIVDESQTEFYRLLGDNIRVLTNPEHAESDKLIFLTRPEILPEGYTLHQIITGSTHQNADLLYIFTLTPVEDEEIVIE